MALKPHVQCKVTRGTTTTMTTWLPVIPGLRRGTRITIKGITGIWTVVTRGQRERDLADIEHTFKAGGL